jgi:hypothetical protein
MSKYLICLKNYLFRREENLMQVKKLPVAVPAIIGLHYHAFSLTPIFCNKKYLPWFYSHYIQVYCTNDFSEVNGSPWFNFVSIDLWDNGIPFLSNNHLLDLRTIKDNKIDVVKLITGYIDRGWYTDAEVDDFYIPFRFAYQKKKKPHDILIFGYDLNNKCFDTAGFNTQNEFAYEKLSFDDFEKAFLNNNSTMVDLDNGGTNCLRFFKTIEGIECDFDPILLAQLLEDYLNSADTTEKFRMFRQPSKKRVYGIETYQFFKEYFHLLLNKEIKFDIRPIQLLWEHKKCMLLRIKYMSENNIISPYSSIYDDYVDIEQKVLSARNLMIKYNMTNEKKVVMTIIDIIDEIKNKEQVILTSLLKELPQKQLALAENIKSDTVG